MIRSWLQQVQWDKAVSGAGSTCFVYLFGISEAKGVNKIIQSQALPWQKTSLLKSKKDMLSFQGKKGPVLIFKCKKAPSAVSHHGMLEESAFSSFRDIAGGVLASCKSLSVEKIQVECSDTTHEQELGFLTGLEIAAYSFREQVAGKSVWPKLAVRRVRGKIDRDVVASALARARAVNLARHLVNLPPNELNPSSYAQMIKGMKNKNLSVEVWDDKRLGKEKMGLHLAVGRGAENPPCLVHMKWRPSGTQAKKMKPVAFVGKGITFDSGGLDIKPSAGMRLMKKDMGGSAAVVGLAQWAMESNYPGPLDFYVALAENAVDANSFRPSDIVTARNGAKVEIDNTDAEGRLVLADALDVAVTAKDEPETIINIATLTGAIKVALGAEVAGLFSNDDSLSLELAQSGQAAGDLSWRMPLMEKYWGSLSSPFADFKNSADGFGGAITAALFLSRFVRNKRWAHLDIYAWADKASGALLSSGGNGQAVQCLVEWLERRAALN